MTGPQIAIFIILGVTMALFLSGRFRHDVVALAALMASVVAGVVPSDEAFLGFGNPAVITVACVLVLSFALQHSGAVDALARTILPKQAGRTTSLAALIGLGALLSGFMNNVGAMALLMPIAVQLADRLKMAQGQILMPLAFGTILGGMTTLVGTPPNLIVSGFRQSAGLGGFSIFDFSWVGVPVAVVGVLFIALIGWRLVPVRKAAGEAGFVTSAYLTEVRIPETSKVVGMTLSQFENALDDLSVQIVAILRRRMRINFPSGERMLRADDVLILEADVGDLGKAVSMFDLKLEEDEPVNILTEALEETDEQDSTDGADGTSEKDPAGVDEFVLREFAVMSGAPIIGRSAQDIHLGSRYGISLLAVSREGQRPDARLRSLKLKSGDLLLTQGPVANLTDFAAEAGCVPLSDRDLRLPDKRNIILSSGIMVSAVVLVTFGLLSAAVAFAMAVLASMLFGTVPLRKVYTAIDWPVVVLLACLMPVAGAMQTTGAADVLASFLVNTIAQGNAIAALAVILITTMFLSDVMNNAATAAVMCPIALGIANSLGVNPDGFFMAVAIGASCAFLTPIGHQNNTLILGPGGFKFGDYWKLGVPLEVLVVAVSMPLLLIFWPL